MTEERPALAIRIPRPWTTEEDFLANESDTISRTGILLLGTHSRPQGTILRFEVTLQTGAPMVRGEGRVVSYTEDAFDGQPGLLLKFTRLDPKSKALVDRVAAQRQGPPSLSTSSVAVAALGPMSVRGYPLSQHPADVNESTAVSSGTLRTNPPPSPSPATRPMTMPPPNATPSYRPSAPPPMSVSPSTIPPARPSGPPPVPNIRRSVPPPLPAAARLSKRPSVPPQSEGSSTSVSAFPPDMAPSPSLSRAPQPMSQAPAPQRPSQAPPATLLSSRPSQPPASQRSPSPPPAPASGAGAGAAPRMRSNAPPTLAAMTASAVMAGTPVPSVVAPREASYSRTRAIQAPPNREDLLTRLRARATSLPEETRAKILAGKAPTQDS